MRVLNKEVSRDEVLGGILRVGLIGTLYYAAGWITYWVVGRWLGIIAVDIYLKYNGYIEHEVMAEGIIKGVDQWVNFPSMILEFLDQFAAVEWVGAYIFTPIAFVIFVWSLFLAPILGFFRFLTKLFGLRQ